MLPPGHAKRPMLKRVLRHPRVLRPGMSLLGAYLRWALRTTRWTLHGREALGPYLLGGGAVFAFWHERLPFMPALWTLAVRSRAAEGAPPGRMYVLVSRNRDGRLIGDVMRSFGLELVHGSTAKNGVQKGGAAGLRALSQVLAAGGQVVITPDGPRGPRRVAAPGVAQLAALAGVPVVPCAAQSRRRRVLPTWDRMMLPLPYGRGVLVCGPPLAVPRVGWAGTLPALEAALTAVADEADALCRA